VKFIQTALILAGLAVVTCAAFAFWVRAELLAPYFAGASEGTFVNIPRGADTRAIADALADAGVLQHSLPFYLYVRWTGSGRHLQAGEYQFNTPATPTQVLDRIIRGDIYFVAVTVPEGLTAHETLEIVAGSGVGSLPEMTSLLARTDWLHDLDPGAASLEGYLFPETYHFTRAARSEEIVKSMVGQFRTRYEKLARRFPPGPGWNAHRIVTLASLIEKESGKETERPLVASVFFNRLERGIPLACDPTIIYALKAAGRYDGNIRKADLSLDSPYNTYVHPGLPPGPIANPGAASLEAAIHPANTDYLYFVSRNDGTHQFSSDYRAHSMAVLRYQKRGR
jgi:UPF0755 protein